MKKLLFFLLLGISEMCFSQGTLYVLSDESDYIDEIAGLGQTVSDLETGIDFYQYGQGEWSITSNSVEIKWDIYLGYNDDPGFGCGGPCGQFQWYCERFADNGQYDFFDTIGPFGYTENFTEGCLIIEYQAIYVPNMPEPSEPICETDPMFDDYNGNTFNIDAAHLKWQYLSNTGWQDLPNFSDLFPLNKSVIEIFGDDYSSYFSNVLTLRYSALNVAYTKSYNIDIIGCSPNLVGNPQTTNETCYGENDGSVELTLDGNVDTSNSEIRFYVYEGAPPSNPSDVELQADPPVFPNQTLLDPLITLEAVGDGSGNYTGTLNGLTGGNATQNSLDYYIIYQEVDYTTIPVTVKSGKTTPQFTIERPSEVIASGSITAPQTCGDTAKIAFSAIGGNNLDSSGNYAYQYRLNGGAWTTAAQNPQPIALGPVAQNVAIKAIYSVGNCESAEVTLTDQIDPAPPELVITNTSFVAPSSGNSPDGSIRVQISGGTANYTYVLSILNTGTGLFETNENISNSNVTTVDFFGKSVGTYRIIITDTNGCPVNSGDIVVTAVPPPTLGAEQTNQISCVGGSDGSIAVDVSGGVLNYNYQWTINGTISAIQTTGSQTISLNNISEPGEYILKVGSNGFSDFNDASGYVSTTITLNIPEEVIFVSAIPNDISCFGTLDGSIVVTASGGTSYQYKLGFFGAWTDLDSNTIPISSEGFYDVYLRNQNGCESPPITGIFVAEPEILEVTGTSTNATTNGGSEGTITLTVTGGTTPYTNYAWQKDGQPFTPSIGSTDVYLIDVAAGIYQVMVTDTNTCMATSANIIVIEPGPLGITSLTPTDVLCNGGNTGSITAVVTGVAPFNYFWERQDGQPITSLNAPTIDNLSEGIYILRLTDASGDPEVTDIVTITEPLEILDATVTPTAATCFGGNDGSIQITALGGTAPYEYAIDDGFGFQASDTFTNLAPRTYAVTVRDANNCVFNSTTIVDQPIEITVTTDVISNVSVAGGADGAIFITVNDGTAPYGISWSGPNGYINTIEDITGLEAGTYTLEIRDANHITDLSGCYFTQDFVMIEPGPLAITALNPTEVLCNGEATGSITAVVTGTAPFTYVWTRDGDLTFTAPDQPTITNLLAGIYTLTVTDNTVTPAVTQSVTIIEPLEALTAVGLTFNVSCFGGSDGSIQINATGGTAPYTYSLEGSAFQSGNTFPNLISGTYNVTVMDANNCEFIIPTPIIVDQPQEMGLLVDQQLSLSAANAADGAIAITVFGGTAPYTFEWFADIGFTSTDEDIANLAGGNYTLVVRDNNQQNDADGCTYTQDFIIAEPGVLVATITQTVFLECNSDDFGEIEANVQGGVTPYTYEWFQIINGNDTALVEDTEILGNLSEGEYFVRITDTNSISFDATPVTIAQPDLLEIIVDATTQIQCSNDPTGAIAISVTGGTQPYQYYWSNGEITEDLNNLQAGDYTLEIVDTNGCLAEETITINSPDDALQIVNATITNISAYEANDGSIVLELGGGTAPYTIDWTRLSDNTNVGDQEAISNLSADTYEVLVSDANGCTVMQTYEVTQPDIVEETIIQPTCAGESNGSIEVLVNQGNGFFTYSWSTGETTSGISGLEGGSYSVTITGFGDGPITRAYEILDPLPLEVDLGEDRVLCTAQELLLDATVADGTATYTWTSDNGFLSSDPSVLITASGNYTVLVQTQTGCTAEGSIFVNISTDEISADFAVSSQVFVGETLVAVDISYPLPESLEWVLPEGAQVLKQDSDELELTFAEAGEYEIGIITTRGDCIAQQTKKVLVTDQDGSVLDQDTENGRKLIEDFIIYPNPTDGRFTAEVNLTERGNISIKVFSFANNALMASEKYRGEMSYSIPFDLSSLPSGVYAVLLETPYGNSLRKIIVI